VLHEIDFLLKILLTDSTTLPCNLAAYLYFTATSFCTHLPTNKLIIFNY